MSYKLSLCCMEESHTDDARLSEKNNRISFLCNVIKVSER